MIFLTYWFVLFATAFLPIYWLVPGPLPKRLVLLAGCAIFHTHFAGPAGVIPIVILGVLTYWAGRSGDRRACLITIWLCVAALIFYKYTLFLSQQLLGVFAPDAGALAKDWALRALPKAPPLAISFFTFEFVHYLYDVRAGQPPIRAPLDFALFSIFWPSIVSGPVKRYQQFLASLAEGTGGRDWPGVCSGLIRVGCGLIKKFAADSLTAFIAADMPKMDSSPSAYRWLLLMALTMRIYLDFSGYSDMAIGYGRMLGVKLPENFNWPYLARDMVDFWRRWHMSLSLWIRDYVYIPLGGNRHGPVRKAANALIAFALCGLWHGAGWNFAVWGIYHGLGVVATSAYATALGPVARPVSWIFGLPLVGWLFTFLYVSIGWLFFFYPVGEAFRLLRLLFS
jgi:alginate O-acetyltransferase complex protein AlgI